jgi:hypothetical protein
MREGPHRTTLSSGFRFLSLPFFITGNRNILSVAKALVQKTPGHQKAARRGGEKDEGIFQRIGLSGSMAWSAEYPFTGCIIATQPYRKMTPRLPDGHQIFPFRTGRQAGQSFKLHFLSLNFHVISGGFFGIYLQQLLG